MNEFNFIELFYKKLKTEKPDWFVKGIIDTEKNIITLGTDSKLIGRIFELKCNALLQKIAEEKEGYELFKSAVQTEYPDFYYCCPDGKRIAIDIKTTYLDYTKEKKNIAYTLGSYKSFLRDGKKGINGKYSDYKAHYVIGFVYERVSNEDGKILPFTEENFESIKIPYENVQVWVQEKYKITGLIEGSGDTTNIGSISRKDITDFVKGNGPFSSIDKLICDDYWRNYKNQTLDYRTIEDYFRWANGNSGLRGKVNLKIEEQKYLQWRKVYAPTKEDYADMATKVILLEGPKGGFKSLVLSNADFSLKFNDKAGKALLEYCKSKNKKIISIIV